ncbi:Swt1 family HEPN domain-containing protein [Capilliphycus salinus ALCB114379]|uniref:Swt1 family HEPN domain-containing protein n=1 Tax=Capilliphycus salinus TaxID=2768948 RepID=UPI0039A4F7F7
MMNIENYFCWKGGTLEDEQTYVERKADQDLYNFGQIIHREKRVCFVLAPRQMGKSSLMNRTVNHLRQDNIACVMVNLHGLGKVNAEEDFWFTLLYRICVTRPDSEPLTSQLLDFWESHKQLLSSEIFTLFLVRVILSNLTEDKLVIFLDEVQSLIRWNLQDTFIRYVRAISDNVENPALQKLSFVLLGVAKPSEFTQDSDANLNLGTKTELDYLSGDCIPLQKGLEPIASEPKKLIDRILYWTGGQPFLTQFSCQLLIENLRSPSPNLEDDIDFIIRKHLLNQWRNNDPQYHFQGIENLFIKINPEQISKKLEVLTLYEKILNQDNIKFKPHDESQADLLMSGLVVKSFNGPVAQLKIANKIYQQIFNYEWIDEMREKLAGGTGQTEDEPADEIENTNIQELENSAIVKKGLKILAKSLRPFVNKQMSKSLGKEWKNLPEVRKIIRPDEQQYPLKVLDSQKLLKLIVQNWNTVFSQVLNIKHKNWVYELLTTRNQEAHEVEFDDKMTERALDTIECLLRAIGATDEAAKVDGIKMNKFPRMMKNPQPNRMKDGIQFEKKANTNQQDNNFMDTATRIATILEKRQPRGKKVRSIITHLESLDSQLNNMEGYRNRILTQIDDIAVIEKLRILQFDPMKNKVKQNIQQLEKLHKRFSRQTLTIAFVGRAGQGKSRFIQTLTGLTDVEVPDGNMNNCTGVRVTISHAPNRSTSGEVYFHTERSFLEHNIYPYYDFLNLGNKPKNFAEFINTSLPPLTLNTSEAKALYAHLDKCHTNHSSYSHWLQQSSPKQISREEIRTYVAQTDEANHQNLFNYLAVQEVKIFCQFPCEDVGKISLIDLPGLGDTVLGDTERLRQSLGQDVDFGLFIYMPDKRLLQEPDYKLYDTANSALVELPIKKWSFMVLNRVSNPKPGIAENGIHCEEAKNRIDTEGRIQVARCVIANCAETNEAAGVLSQVLDYLETHILDLDGEYAERVNRELKQLQTEINTFLDKARHAFISSPKSITEVVAFRNLFKEFDNSITFGLRKLVQELCPEELDADQNQKDADFFGTIIDSLIQKCNEDTGIPSQEEIWQMYYSLGAGATWGGVFRSNLNAIRTHLRTHFRSVDNGLKDYVDAAKAKVADVFTQTSLGNLTSARGIEFIDFMAKEIPEHYPVLKSAFQTLVSFEMSYRSNFQHRILKALEQLNPDRAGDVFSVKDKTEEELVKLIHQVLTTFHRNTVCACREALEKFEGEPSLAAFAVIDEFVDEVVRSQDIDKQWEDFMRERSTEIWPNNFGEKVGLEKREWEQLIEQAMATNQVEFI